MSNNQATREEAAADALLDVSSSLSRSTRSNAMPTVSTPHMVPYIPVPVPVIAKEKVEKNIAEAKVEKNGCCNRTIFNRTTGKREGSCGRTPIVFQSKKQRLCAVHRDERNEKQNLRNQNSRLKSKGIETITGPPPPSMSLICSLTEDGFFLDVWPSTHVRQENPSKETPIIHHGSMKRVHIPHTYMILFHKFLLHGGSANTTNHYSDTGQQRLFAYVNTEFLPTIKNKMDYKSIMNMKHTTDIPQPEYSFRPYKMCTSADHIYWNCGKDECKGRDLNHSSPTEPHIIEEWDKTAPGTVVHGDMDKLGYIIVRTSITKEECPYLLLMETKLNGWTSIHTKSGQPLVKNPKREQIEVTMPENQNKRGSSEQDKGRNMKKTVAECYDIAFSKLEKDVISVNTNYHKEDYWTQTLVHRKILRNVGQITRQYPHSDYGSVTIRSRKNVVHVESNAAGDSPTRQHKRSNPLSK